jgi:hypothetical protein
MISCHIIEPDGIAVVEPSGPLSEEDFSKLTDIADAYIESHGMLNGLLIHTREFPGWENFSGMIHHLRFIKDHHRKIKRVALVSDSKITSFGPTLAAHFVSAEIRSFPYDAYNEALQWLTS